MVRLRLKAFWEGLSTAFWFIPILMTAASIGLFALTWFVSQSFEGKPSGIPGIFDSGPRGARTILAAIMTGFISVGGTIFSVAILILQLASSQYTPRLLPRNLIGDRGTQVVLGVFLGMSVYTILGIRATSLTGDKVATAFSSLVSGVGVLWALACVVALTYFLAHVATLIQSAYIVQSAQDMALKRISSLSSIEKGQHEDLSPTVLDPRDLRDGVFDQEPIVVRARRSGYLQVVNGEVLAGTLSSMVQRSGKVLAVEVPYSPGDFISGGEVLAKIWPAPDLRLSSGSKDKIHKSIRTGRERSFDQDFAFGLRQLSDVALKGLSSDPSVSLQALDRIKTIFIALGDKEMTRRVHEMDKNGTQVVLGVRYYGFDEAVDIAFDQLRRAALSSGQVAVLEHLIKTLGEAIQSNELPERREALWKRVMSISRQVPQQITDSGDAVELLLCAVRAGAPLLRTEQGQMVGENLEEIARLSENIHGGDTVKKAVENS